MIMINSTHLDVQFLTDFEPFYRFPRDYSQSKNLKNRNYTTKNRELFPAIDSLNPKVLIVLFFFLSMLGRAKFSFLSSSRASHGQ